MPISELLPPRVAVNREVLEKLSDQERMQVAIHARRRHAGDASGLVRRCPDGDQPVHDSSARLNLEAAGSYALRCFEAADRDAVFERLEPLIDGLETVSHATELAVQRD